MLRDEWELTTAAMTEATKSVLAEYGAHIDHRGKSYEMPSSWARVAVIGFAGPALRGMLVLAVDSELLLRTCPVDDMTCAEEDWLGELANLVLGRFKSLLLRLGITVHLSTPVIVHGPALTLDTAAVSTVVHHFVSDRDERLYVMLDAIAEPATHVGEATLATVVASGEVILFEG